MKEPLKSENIYEMLWSYFSFHGNQRITILNFYIILESAMIGGFMALDSSKIQNASIFEVAIGIALIFFSLIFYLMDLRTKHMIKISEAALIKIEEEQKMQDPEVLIFSQEKKKTSEIRKNKLMKLLSYSNLFGLIYMFFTLAGIALILFSFIA